MKSFLLALQFLSIIPIRYSGPVTQDDLIDSVVFYPAIGLLYGLIAYGVYLATSNLLPAMTVSALILAIIVTINGGFHLDGLADTFDALAVKTTKEPDYSKRLNVMKDSHIGAIGVIAIVLVLTLKFSLIHAVLSSLTAVATLLFAPVLSRFMAVLALYTGRPARSDGLGSIFFGRLSKWHLLASGGVVGAIVVALFYTGLHVTLAGIGACLISTHLFMRLCSQKFGGLTGDNVGAIIEITEVVYLLASVLTLL